MRENPYYQISFVNHELVFVKWFQTPPQACEDTEIFIEELKAILKDAQNPIYILSDLTQGQIVDVVAIRKLARITKAQQYGGSVAFGSDTKTAVYGGLFATVAHRADEIQPDLSSAIEVLQTLKSDILSTGDEAVLVALHNAKAPRLTQE
jgi:hypothetical protein